MKTTTSLGAQKEVFEKAYRKTDALTYGIAIELLKQGKRLARTHWKDGSFIYLQKGYKLSKEFQTIFIITADNHIGTWAVSTEDMLAEDWKVVE